MAPENCHEMTKSLTDTSSLASTRWSFYKNPFGEERSATPYSGDAQQRESSSESLTALPPLQEVESCVVRDSSVDVVTPQQHNDLEKDADHSPPAPPPGMDPKSFPDGGYDAWMTVLGGFCCLFVSFGWINCIGVFQTYYETHQLQSLSPSSISWIPSTETCMMFFCGPFVGKILDNHGPRWPLLFGSILHVFGLMMISVSTTYYQLILAQGVCSGIGAACVFYPALSTTSSWFFRRRALAMGIVTSGSSLGGVILPIMFAQLIPRIGFPWAMRTAAFLILALLAVANLTLRSRLPPARKPFVLAQHLRPFTEAPFALVTAAAFLFFLGMFLPLNFLMLQAVTAGTPSTLVPYLLPILNATGTIGRLALGHLADRRGRITVQTALCLTTALLVLALWLPGAASTPCIVLFAALYGATTGALVSAGPAIIAQISPDVRQIGVRNGSFFAVVGVASLVGNPIGGALVASRGGNFEGLMVFGGVVQLAGAAVYAAARVSVGGRRWSAKV